MRKPTESRILPESLRSLIKKYSKNDVIAEMEKEYESNGSKNLSLALIDDNSFIKRVAISSEIVDRFAKGISENGLWNPLIVRPSGSHYELILGRKRYFGAKKDALAEVPCVIVEATDEETLLMLLADTRDQREGNVVEMALVYKELTTRFGYSQATLAAISHESRSQVTNTIRILSLPDRLLSDISLGKLSYGHAKAIASLSEAETETIVSHIYEHHLSVRETERLVRQRSAIPSPAPDEEEKLRKATGASSLIIKKTAASFEFPSEYAKDRFLKSLLGK
jgi:ParB family transcriptional regulator, chromosome partitioning protein